MVPGPLRKDSGPKLPLLILFLNIIVFIVPNPEVTVRITILLILKS